MLGARASRDGRRGDANEVRVAPVTAGRRPTLLRGQLAAVIERWRDHIEHDHVVIAGDVNASLQGPSVIAHRRNLDVLADLGAQSAYKLANGPVPATEEAPTLRWIGPGRKPYFYHCDFIFVSNGLAGRVRSAEVGSRITDYYQYCFVSSDLTCLYESHVATALL